MYLCTTQKNFYYISIYFLSLIDLFKKSMTFLKKYQNMSKFNQNFTTTKF